MLYPGPQRTTLRLPGLTLLRLIQRYSELTGLAGSLDPPHAHLTQLFPFLTILRCVVPNPNRGLAIGTGAIREHATLDLPLHHIIGLDGVEENSVDAVATGTSTCNQNYRPPTHHIPHCTLKNLASEARTVVPIVRHIHLDVTRDARVGVGDPRRMVMPLR